MFEPRVRRSVVGTLDSFGVDEKALARFADAFAGRHGNRLPLVQIKAPDNGAELCFNSRELFFRFCSMDIATQKLFLQSVREIISNYRTNIVEIDVSWSSTSARKERLYIQQTGPVNGDLLFDM